MPTPRFANECQKDRNDVTDSMKKVYTINGWVEPTLLNLKACLTGDDIPKAPEDCEFCGYVVAAAGAA